MILRDKEGWPVEKIRGRWFMNLLHVLFDTNIRVTVRRWRNQK